MRTGQTFIAVRAFEAQGKKYAPGDTIDLTGWPHKREELLIDRRFIRRAPHGLRVYVALRDFPVGDTLLKKGDQVPPGLLSPEKLEQLYSLRYVTYTDTGTAPLRSGTAPAATQSTVKAPAPAAAPTSVKEKA